MEIREVSDSVAIYSDGRRLRVIHNLGAEFFLDLSLKSEVAFKLVYSTDILIRTVSALNIVAMNTTEFLDYKNKRLRLK